MACIHILVNTVYNSIRKISSNHSERIKQHQNHTFNNKLLVFPFLLHNYVVSTYYVMNIT